MESLSFGVLMLQGNFLDIDIRIDVRKERNDIWIELSFGCTFWLLFCSFCIDFKVLGAKHILCIYDEIEELWKFVAFFEVVGMTCKYPANTFLPLFNCRACLYSFILISETCCISWEERFLG